MDSQFEIELLNEPEIDITNVVDTKKSSPPRSSVRQTIADNKLNNEFDKSDNLNIIPKSTTSLKPRMIFPTVSVTSPNTPNKESVSDLMNDEVNPISSIIDQIKTEISQIQSLGDPQKMKFDLPESVSADIISELVKSKLTRSPKNTECADLANGKLNSVQLADLRTKGSFDVPSKDYPGQNHTWKVSPLLQTGITENNEYVTNYFAGMYKAFFISIPNRWNNDNEGISVVDSMISLKYGFSMFLNLFIGDIKIKPQYSESELCDKMEKYCLTKLKELEVPNNYLLNNLSEQEYKIKNILANSLKKLEINWKSELDAEHKKFDDTVGLSTTSTTPLTINTFTSQLSNFVSSDIETLITIDRDTEDLFDSTAVETSDKIIYQSKVTNILKNSLDPATAAIMIQIMTSIRIFKSIKEHYYSHKDKAYQTYMDTLKQENPIRCKVPEFVEYHEKLFSSKYEKRWPLDLIYSTAASKLIGTDRLIFNRVISITRSTDYLRTLHKLKEEYVPIKRFNWKFIIWNPDNWIVMEHGDANNKYYSCKKYHTVQTSTATFFWRWGNIAMRTCEYFNSMNYYFLNNLIYGKFGCRSLWGLDNYISDVSFNSTTGKPVYSLDNVTWIGRIQQLWGDIHNSRTAFEAAPDNGILGKDISRVFNILWNYVIKGACGTIICFVGHPIMTIFSSLTSIVLTLLSPVMSLVSAFLKYLFDIIIYDFDYPKDSVNFGKIFIIVLWKFVIGTIGQGICSVLGMLAHGFHGLSYLFPIIWCGMRYIYDAFVYHLILKHRVRIPAADHFLVRRVSGPGLSSNYYYCLDYSVGLILIQYQLDKIKLKQSVSLYEKKIKEPLTKLKEKLSKFNEVGLGYDSNLEPVKTFEQTQEDLLERLRKESRALLTNLNLENTDKIRFDLKNLNKVSELGSVMCKDFMTTNIFPKMTASEIDAFWTDRRLPLNDYSGLSMNLLKELTNNEIGTPLETTDKNGFTIDVTNSLKSSEFVKSARAFVKGLFTNSQTTTATTDVSDDYFNDINKLDTVSDYGKVVPIEDIVKQVVLPSEVFSSDPLDFDTVIKRSVQNFDSDQLHSKLAETSFRGHARFGYVSY